MKLLKWLMSIILRTAICLVTIVLLNKLFVQLSFPISLGLNPFTLLTSAALGFPGIVLLYGIVWYISNINQ